MEIDLLEILGIAAIPVITVICLLVGAGVKKSSLDDSWIPLICGACGGVLGVVAMYTMPDFPGHDVLTAIAYGIVSGFGATGIHQAVKQRLNRDV